MITALLLIFITDFTIIFIITFDFISLHVFTRLVSNQKTLRICLIKEVLWLYQCLLIAKSPYISFCPNLHP